MKTFWAHGGRVWQHEVCIIVAGFLIALGSAANAQATRPAAPKAKLPPGVQAFTDLKYGEAPGVSNLLDIYLPVNPQGAMPLVIWIHGGCWAGGDKLDAFVVAPMVRRMVHRGYVIASINYRMLPKAIYPAEIEDCKGAVRWLRAHAAEYHIDPKRVGVAGLSAGGHLVALLGTTAGVESLEGTVGGNLDQSSAVQAVCDDAGPTDFTKFFEQAGPNNIFRKNPDKTCLADLLGGGPISSHKAMAAWANPITYVSSDDPPFLILQGDKDAYVPWQQSQILADALEASHVECHLILIPGVNHGGGEMLPSTLRAREEFFDKYLHPAEPLTPAKK